MNVDPRPSGRWGVFGLILFALVALGASPPEVVQVRVPSNKVANWFPAGSDYQMLPYDRFEDLLRSARERPALPRDARLLKARHSARWESGRLIGKTEVSLEAAPGPEAGLLILEPWSPALVDRGVGPTRLRATRDGQLAIKLDPAATSTVAFDWIVRARPGSEGRAFALELPRVDVASLALELPAGLVPESSIGPRVGPDSGATPGVSSWRFEAARGPFDLRLLDPSRSSARPGPTGLWLEGPTRIDLGSKVINWRADWTLEASTDASRTLTIGLDPGLEVVDVVGPRVASFRPESDGSGSKVAIQLNAEGSGPSPLEIRAICQVPAEGTWPVPSARPLDATWTGGQTLVRLDAGRVFQSCRELSGRRVPPRPGDPTASADLIFEPTGRPGPVADLTFRKPMADANVDVRGHLILGEDAPRVDVALTWSVEKGRMFSFAADLPPGWTPGGVTTVDGQQVPWHSDALSNGGTRVHLSPPSAGEVSRSMTLILSGSAARAGVTGPFDLPRVRPAPGARVVDEIWVATPAPGLAVRPILAGGLAWLDPKQSAADHIPVPWKAADLDGALAWRWLVDGAEARIDRTRIGLAPQGRVRLEATIRAARVALDWEIEVESPRADLDPLPIHLDEAGVGPILWRSRDAGGPIVEPRPMDDARRASLGFPTTGQALDLSLSGPTRGKLQLVGRLEAPWSGRGRIPILTLPDRYKTSGAVALVVEHSTRVAVESPGLTPFEPDPPGEEPSDLPADRASGPDPRMRKAGEFGYRSGGGRLVVATTDLRSSPRGGFIRDAFLVSHVSPGGGMRHRLTLGIAGDRAFPLELAMPKGIALDRLRREGLAVEPIPSGGHLIIEIPAPGVGHPLTSLTLEYRTEDDARSGPIEPAGLLPACSLDCLGFAWEIVVPESWAVGDPGEGLESADPRPAETLAGRLLGFHWSPWGDRVDGRSSKAAAEMLGDLERSAKDVGDGETNLGDWLVKLDAGKWPLAVDRLALRSIGWGPASRIDSRTGAGQPLGPVRSILEPMGLAAIPLGGMILITAKEEVPALSPGRDAWAAAIREVLAEGSDRADRFQSAARWRGEATPRSLASGESPGPSTGPGNWRIWRVVSENWPLPGATVSLIDERAGRAWGWFVSSAVLAAGLLACALPARVRGLGLAAIGIFASLEIARHWPDVSSTGPGLLRGALAVLAFWVGRSFRAVPARRPASPNEGSTTSRRSGFLGRMSLVPSLALAMGLGIASAGDEAEAPILALLPFEGPADPTSKPDRAILRVKDLERLERLARRDDLPAVARASIISLSHRVGREAPGFAVVESSYEVEVDGKGAAAWSFPVGQALELSAEVDARPTPLAISPDGRTASLTLEGPGTRRLRFRRLAPLSGYGREGERMRIPIHRAAFATVEVMPGGGPSRAEVVGASGGLAVEAGGTERLLGPLDTLEVRWFPEQRPPSSDLRGAVEATLLWDARPVGDSIRMKLTHSDPDGASTIRLAMGPGLVVRRHTIPGIVSVRDEGTAGRPEWVARVDPPLPKDLPIEVEFWRPALAGSASRTWPEVDVPTASKFSGLIGFRRPGDWSGRLEPPGGGGIEPATDVGFVKAWGDLPQDGLTLAGAARFDRSTTIGVETGPVPPRRSVRANVRIRTAPGRLDASIEAVLSDRQGRSFDLEVAVPTDLRVVRVEADGLLDWRRIARDHLRLQFDGSEVLDRKIRIEGSLPAPADSAMSEARTYQAKVAWPRWADAESVPGTLEIAGPIRFQFEPGDGLVAIPPTMSEEPDLAFRAAYRVDRPGGPWNLSWSAPPARVDVAVDSELVIDPTSLSWTAALTCEVSGGPANTLSLSLPSEWAGGASLEVEGLTHRLASQVRGLRGEITQWTITPDSPIWGVARLVLRSKQTLRPGREFVYPQVAPLGSPGRGTVRRYDLAILNGTGRPMEISGSSGLQPVDISRIPGVDSPSALRPSRSLDHAYHVTGERWSLRLKVGRPGDEVATAREARGARVATARLDCIVGADGSAWGRARLDLETQPGPFLVVHLPEGAEIPWQSADGAIGPAYRDGPGRWLIPLGDGEPRGITFAWHRPGSGRPPSGVGPLPFPSFDHPPPTTLISASGPGDLALTAGEKGVNPIGQVDWEVGVVEQLVKPTVDALADLDRGSRRDREAILDDLTEIELRVRRISRLTPGHDNPADPIYARLQAALNLIAEASQAAGLEELVQEARVRVGVAQATDDSVGGPAASNPEVVRLRRSETVQFFRAANLPPTIDRRVKAPARHWGSAGSWSVASAGFLAWLTIGTMFARGFRPEGRLAIGIALLAILVFLPWEPAGTLAALGLLCWGRLSH